MNAIRPDAEGKLVAEGRGQASRQNQLHRLDFRKFHLWLQIIHDRHENCGNRRIVHHVCQQGGEGGCRNKYSQAEEGPSTSGTMRSGRNHSVARARCSGQRPAKGPLMMRKIPQLTPFTSSQFEGYTAHSQIADSDHGHRWQPMNNGLVQCHPINVLPIQKTTATISVMRISRRARPWNPVRLPACGLAPGPVAGQLPSRDRFQRNQR